MKKLDSSIGMEYPMFWDLVLRGKPSDLTEETSKIMNIISEKQKHQTKL